MIFKYFQKKKERAAEIKASNEKREQEREARIVQEKNRTILIVPNASVKNILTLYDAYRDDEINKNVNKYLLWKKIEATLPETIEGNWFIHVSGSNVIKIKQIFSDVHCEQGYYYDNEYRDSYWDATRKKLVS